MLYVKMTCGGCANTFEVYSQAMNCRDNPVRCPHCLQQMDAKHWDNLIDAFFTASDWNYQVFKAHDEHGTPLFDLEFLSKHVPVKEIIRSLELEV